MLPTEEPGDFIPEISDDEAAWLRGPATANTKKPAKSMFRGLVDLLARCTVMQLQHDSKVYFLHRDDGAWFITTEFFPGQVIVRECQLSDDRLRLSMLPLLEIEGGSFHGL